MPAADVVEHARHAHDHRGDQDDEAENDKHDTLRIFALYPVTSEFESSQRRARTWPGGRSARNGHVHGSGGGCCDLANLCNLPACTRSLAPQTVKIIPRIFRIMET